MTRDAGCIPLTPLMQEGGARSMDEQVAAPPAPRASVPPDLLIPVPPAGSAVEFLSAHFGLMYERQAATALVRDGRAVF